jgi:hypothetical protein
MEALYPILEEEYDKEYRARYIEGQTTTIVICFCTLILVLNAWKPNKHFYVFVGSFDPPCQGL